MNREWNDQIILEPFEQTVAMPMNEDLLHLLLGSLVFIAFVPLRFNVMGAGLPLLMGCLTSLSYRLFAFVPRKYTLKYYPRMVVAGSFPYLLLDIYSGFEGWTTLLGAIYFTFLGSSLRTQIVYGGPADFDRLIATCSKTDRQAFGERSVD